MDFDRLAGGVAQGQAVAAPGGQGGAGGGAGHRVGARQVGDFDHPQPPGVVPRPGGGVAVVGDDEGDRGRRATRPGRGRRHSGAAPAPGRAGSRRRGAQGQRLVGGRLAARARDDQDPAIGCPRHPRQRDQAGPEGLRGPGAGACGGAAGSADGLAEQGQSVGLDRLRVLRLRPEQQRRHRWATIRPPRCRRLPGPCRPSRPVPAGRRWRRGPRGS